MQRLQGYDSEAYKGVQREVFEAGRSGEEGSRGCSHCARIISGTTATARTRSFSGGGKGCSPRRTKRHRRGGRAPGQGEVGYSARWRCPRMLRYASDDFEVC